jgi:ribosome biogenesis GTPase
MGTEQSVAALGWGPFFEKQVTADERRDLLIARVTAVHKHQYALENENGPLTAVIAGKSLYDAGSDSELPVVGDWVLAKPPVGGLAVIMRCLERRSELSRRSPLDRNSSKTSSERQVLAGNLDFVFIVMSLNQDLNPARLERALIFVWNSGATPVVLLSKADLSPDPDAQAVEIRTLARGVDVHAVSSLQGQGVEAVRHYLKTGVTGCLIGSSGVGKTTLINALCGTHHKTLEIREDDGKGRHATSSRALFFLPEGGMLIDTPGVREIGLMDDAGLSAAFADIAELAKACKYTDCTHRVEPECAVLAALAAGRLAQERYDSYLKLCREVEYQTSKQSSSGQQETKRKQKQLGKLIKDFYQESYKRKR